MNLLRDRRGLTLIELIVVVAIFLSVILITTKAFDTIVQKSSQQSKSAQTQIQGAVGLELLRGDLERAGFGLPWEFNKDFGISYEEATFTNASTSTLFNDAPSAAPRALISGGSTFNKGASTYSGAAYLVIKSTLADANETAKKWTTVSFDTAGKNIREWDDADRDFDAAAGATEQVTVIRNDLISTPPTRRLMASSSTAFSTTFEFYSTLTVGHQNGDTFEVYGVHPDTELRMPFNRVDYYVKRPSKMPLTCAPNTGILFRSVVSQADGGQSAGVPLLDCVADMQVVYGLATGGDGVVNDYTTDALNANLDTAAEMRALLKEIRVYILAQEGKKDRFYNYPSTTIDVGESFDSGATITGRRFNLETLIGSDYKHYRWKVYTIVVRPKNLVQ